MEGFIFITILYGETGRMMMVCMYIQYDYFRRPSIQSDAHHIPQRLFRIRELQPNEQHKQRKGQCFVPPSLELELSLPIRPAFSGMC